MRGTVGGSAAIAAATALRLAGLRTDDAASAAGAVLARLDLADVASRLLRETLLDD